MGRESFKGRNMGEEMEAKAKLSPGETTVARESDGLTGDEAEDALNAKMKLPLRKRFVRVEEIPSGAPSMEDQVLQQEADRKEMAEKREIDEIVNNIKGTRLSAKERGEKRADFKDSDTNVDELIRKAMRETDKHDSEEFYARIKEIWNKAKGIKETEKKEEPEGPIKVNGMDISSAVSGSNVHRRATYTNIDNGGSERSGGVGKDSIQVKHKRVAMRKDKQLGKNKPKAD